MWMEVYRRQKFGSITGKLLYENMAKRRDTAKVSLSILFKMRNGDLQRH